MEMVASHGARITSLKECARGGTVKDLGRDLSGKGR